MKVACLSRALWNCISCHANDHRGRWKMGIAPTPARDLHGAMGPLGLYRGEYRETYGASVGSVHIRNLSWEDPEPQSTFNTRVALDHLDSYRSWIDSRNWAPKNVRYCTMQMGIGHSRRNKRSQKPRTLRVSTHSRLEVPDYLTRLESHSIRRSNPPIDYSQVALSVGSFSEEVILFYCWFI